MHLPYLYYYFGTLSPILFIIYCRFLNTPFRFTLKSTILTILIFTQLVHIIVTFPFPFSFVVFRYFWGFIFFYYTFNNIHYFFNRNVLFYLVIIVIIESILINTIISANQLPNFPDTESGATHFAESGSYQRPYGFGGNASVLSVLLVIFLYLVNFTKLQKYITYFSILICASGTGYFAFILYFLNKIKWYYNLLLIICLIPIIYFSFFSKISIEYITTLYDYKIFQFSNEFTLSGFFWGEKNLVDQNELGGDFAILNFIKYNGLVGVLIYAIIILTNINFKNRMPIIIMILTSLHYGVIFSFPGQLIFGYLLSYHSFNKQIKNFQ